MERTYIYDPKRYSYQVTATGIICLIVAVYSVFKLFTTADPMYILLWILVGLIAGYGALGTFAFNFYPQQIKVSDEEISFYCNKKWFTYRIDSIKQINVRAMVGGYEIFIRFTCSDGRKGHYWVKIPQFTEREDLIFELYHILWLINPKSISVKNQARKYDKRPGHIEGPAYTEADFME
ncbi:MAG: hypothetical protein IKU72_02390 [Oscillospiraceae bacterium]|nr:hypothetical protein [Oscillospiraceae bacterium]